MNIQVVNATQEGPLDLGAKSKLDHLKVLMPEALCRSRKQIEGLWEAVASYPHGRVSAPIPTPF